jgi:hypothetical protein
MKLRVLDLFSGIGGFSLGLERTGGFETVAFCEIEPFPRRVLAKHWPKVPCYHDVRELTAARLAADGISVDVICGGFPCQDISLAGAGKGLAGDRSGLWTNHLFFNKATGGRGRSDVYRKWCKSAGNCIVEQGRRHVHGKVSLSMALVRPDKRKRDLSNLLKAVEDLLVSMAVIDDDSLIQRLSVQWVEQGDPCVVLIQQHERALAA